MKDFYKNLGTFLLYFFYSLILFIPVSIIELIFNIDRFENGLPFFFVDVLFILILFLIFKKSLLKDFKDLKKNYRKYIDITIKIWILGLVLMVTSNALITYFTPIEIANNETAIRDLFSSIPIYTAFTTIIYAAFVEEIIFRKTIRNLIKNKWTFIVLSGVIFGGVHVAYSMDSWYSLLYIIPYGIVGSSFAYIYYKTNNIFTTITMHMIHNAILIGMLALAI